MLVPSKTETVLHPSNSNQTVCALTFNVSLAGCSSTVFKFAQEPPSSTFAKSTTRSSFLNADSAFRTVPSMPHFANSSFGDESVELASDASVGSASAVAGS